MAYPSTDEGRKRGMASPTIQAMSRPDVVIAGGGIIGLATAMELVAAGRKVTVFDKDEAMSEASRAAAGMLAAEDPENPAELRELARLSLRIYPDFLRKVEALSGRKVPVRTRLTVQGMRHLPVGTQRLTEETVQELAPGTDTRGWAFFALEEQSFDAWDLAEALPAAARASGVDLREHTPVLGVKGRDGGVQVETAAGIVESAAFLNCTGAWAPALDPLLPIGPKKGHMLTAELAGPLQIGCVLRTSNVYIVPRGANRYTVGPTVEDAGFDKEVYPDRIQALFHKAAELWPPLLDARIAETWTGLRPGSEDGLPILDRTDENRWVAVGHYKNGIMLGPGTAHVLSQWIQRMQPEIDLSAFRSARFATNPVLS